jgi:hypothetical protein
MSIQDAMDELVDEVLKWRRERRPQISKEDLIEISENVKIVKSMDGPVFVSWKLKGSIYYMAFMDFFYDGFLGSEDNSEGMEAFRISNWAEEDNLYREEVEKAHNIVIDPSPLNYFLCDGCLERYNHGHPLAHLELDKGQSFEERLEFHKREIIRD